MAGVEICTLGWGVLQDGQGNKLSGLTPQISGTVYQDSGLTIELPAGSFTSRSDGTLPGFMAPGRYAFVEPVDGTSRTVDVVAGDMVSLGSANVFTVEQEVRNRTAFGFVSGGSPKFQMGVAQTKVRVDEFGNLQAGLNALVEGGDAMTEGKSSLADFFFNQRVPRLFTRNITLAEISDPSDIDLRRFGPENAFPFAKPDNTVGTFADLTGVGTGSLVGQVRGTPARVPFGGDPNTPGGRCVVSGGVISFRTAEMPRAPWDGADPVVGMHIRFSVAGIGMQHQRDVMQLSEAGNLQIGVSALGAGDNGALLQVRGHQGTNEKQTISMSGVVSGGTFALIFYPMPLPVDGYPTGQTTAGIAWNANAAAMQSALEALAGIAPGDVTVTGGPLPGTPIVVEFTGALANTNFVVMNKTSSLTGTNPVVTVAKTVEGEPSRGGKKLVTFRHGGPLGSTPTDSYFEWQDPDGNIVLALTGAGAFQPKKDFAHQGTKVGFYNTAAITKQTGVAVTAAGIHAALVNLGLIAA